jgi:hydrogenase maturation protease
MPEASERRTGRLLVIGYGNTLRSDDGVGQRVALEIERLRLPGVATLTCDLLTPELADPVSRAGTVIFVDAAIDLPREVQLRPLAPADSSQLMAHAADPRTLLALARDVFGHAPRAWWLTVPAENMEIGDQLSPFAQKGAELAIREVLRIAGAPDSLASPGGGGG